MPSAADADAASRYVTWPADRLMRPHEQAGGRAGRGFCTHTDEDSGTPPEPTGEKARAIQYGRPQGLTSAGSRAHQCPGPREVDPTHHANGAGTSQRRPRTLRAWVTGRRSPGGARKAMSCRRGDAVLTLDLGRSAPKHTGVPPGGSGRRCPRNAARDPSLPRLPMPKNPNNPTRSSRSSRRPSLGRLCSWRSDRCERRRCHPTGHLDVAPPPVRRAQRRLADRPE